MKTYTIQPGDSLSKIASMFSTTTKNLQELNRSKYPTLATNPNLLQIGWQLIVPEPTGVPAVPEASAFQIPALLKNPKLLGAIGIAVLAAVLVTSPKAKAQPQS